MVPKQSLTVLGNPSGTVLGCLNSSGAWTSRAAPKIRQREGAAMASSPLQPLVVRHLQIKKTQQGQSILSFFLVFQICFFCSFFSDLQFITSPSSDLLLFYFPAVVLPSSSVADLLWSEEWLKAGGRSCGCSRAWWRSCCWVVFAAGGRRRADLWCPPGEGDPRV